LGAVVRDTDTVARLGGDEFVVLVDDLAGSAALRELMDRMVGAIETPIALDDGPVASVGASLGCAVTDDTDESPDEFLERADRAMYEVKHADRSRKRPSLA
jgi:diguanylate cyclase (GGDEF)-like protein